MDNNDDNPSDKKSPLIEKLEWGRIEVQGFPPGKDFKLYPGGAVEWDWNETNTRHVPGIQKDDVDFLIQQGAKHIILSRGMKKRLEIPEETEEFLKENQSKLGICYYVEETSIACKLYNRLVEEDKLVGALLHSTC